MRLQYFITTYHGTLFARAVNRHCFRAVLSVLEVVPHHSSAESVLQRLQLLLQCLEVVRRASDGPHLQRCEQQQLQQYHYLHQQAIESHYACLLDERRAHFCIYYVIDDCDNQKLFRVTHTANIKFKKNILPVPVPYIYYISLYIIYIYNI